MPDALARVLLLEDDAARRVRDALPADVAAGDGQGRRGHRVLPLQPAARAQRGRRRPGAVRRVGRGVPRRQRRARAAVPAQPARHADARHQALGRRAGADRRADRGWRTSGREHVRAGASSTRRCATAGARRRTRSTCSTRRSSAPGRSSRRAPGGATSRRRCARRRSTRTGSTRTRTGSRRSQRFARALLAHEPFLDDFEPFAERVAAAGEASALGQLLLKLTVPGRARHLPGRRAARADARRPRQPPAGRLGRGAARALDALRDGAAPAPETASSTSSTARWRCAPSARPRSPAATRR